MKNQYIIIQAATASELQHEVNAAYDKGYVVHGSLIASSVTGALMQSMVLKPDKVLNG
jgi:hypothetical protein